MVERPDWHEYFLRVAEVIAQRATCGRRQVGCVLVDDDFNIVSTGYNGPPAGEDNCTPETPCPALQLPSGSRDGLCRAIHAEQNAFLRAHDPWRVRKVYLTIAPCLPCMRLLLNTRAHWIYCREVNPRHDEAVRLWRAKGRLIHVLPRKEESNE